MRFWERIWSSEIIGLSTSDARNVSGWEPIFSISGFIALLDSTLGGTWSWFILFPCADPYSRCGCGFRRDCECRPLTPSCRTRAPTLSHSPYSFPLISLVSGDVHSLRSWPSILHSLMAYLEVKKRRGRRVKGGRVIQLLHLEVF